MVWPVRLPLAGSEPKQPVIQLEELFCLRVASWMGILHRLSQRFQTLKAVPKVARHAEYVAGNQVNAHGIPNKFGTLTSACDLASGVCFDRTRHPDASSTANV